MGLSSNIRDQANSTNYISTMDQASGAGVTLSSGMGSSDEMGQQVWRLLMTLLSKHFTLQVYCSLTLCDHEREGWVDTEN